MPGQHAPMPRVTSCGMLSLAWVVACAAPALRPEASAHAPAYAAEPHLRMSETMDNPLLTPSPLPYELPPFERIENAHFAPAFDQGMQAHREQIAKIAGSAEAPTFDNTIVALERSGKLLSRTAAVFFNLIQSNTNPTLDALQVEVAPRLAAHRDAIYLDGALFARVHALYEARDSLGLDAESSQLLTRYHTRFVRAGAQLAEADKQRLREFNQALSTLTTEFQQAVLKGVNASAVVVDDVAELAGLSPAQIAGAAEAAKARELPGKYLLALVNTTQQPLLSQLDNRALRERLLEASLTRGLPQGPERGHVTTELVARIVALRADRAALLGYPTHAHYVLEDETARTPQAVNEMLARLVPAATRNARAEAKAIQRVIDIEAKAAGDKPFKLEAWDWDYYAERVRKAQYDFDESEVRPYFELDRVLRDGVLFAASKLYGLRFDEREDLRGYHPDVRVFEVFEDGGEALGLCLVDWYARDNKRGGAWMSDFVEQSTLLDDKPVVATNLNVHKPPAGEPALLTFDEVNTAFHEFGHALHGLLSRVRYPMLAGTAVPADFVEYPSQYNEMWATDPTVLAHYAVHHQTGEPMPKVLLDKVLAARKWNQGYATTEYLAAALLDQAYHQCEPGATPAAGEIERFEAAALDAAKIALPIVPPRYRTAYFSHVFADPMGYSAAYYAYIWSEVLARDTEHWFTKHGGLVRENGEGFRDKILSRGFTRDPMTMFEQWKGGPADVQPLLEARGLR